MGLLPASGRAGRGEWAGNADTASGRRAHKATDYGKTPALPAPDDLPDDRTLKTRRLLLASERLGLIAELDVLEAEDGCVTPVDIKTGKRPHVAEGAYLPERVQVCVQALLLRDAGYTCNEGALWFADSRERVRVDITDELVSTTLRAASELRLTVASGRLPPPLDHSPKCARCSLLPICLPDEVNWFRKGAIPRTPPPAASSATGRAATSGPNWTKGNAPGWPNPCPRFAATSKPCRRRAGPTGSSPHCRCRCS